jgi:hypothetical protein
MNVPRRAQDSFGPFPEDGVNRLAARNGYPWVLNPTNRSYIDARSKMIAYSPPRLTLTGDDPLVSIFWKKCQMSEGGLLPTDCTPLKGARCVKAEELKTPAGEIISKESPFIQSLQGTNDVEKRREGAQHDEEAARRLEGHEINKGQSEWYVNH